MLYEHECLDNPFSIQTTSDHVRAHISSVCSMDDDEERLARFVTVQVERVGDGRCIVRGSYEGGEPMAPYLKGSRGSSRAIALSAAGIAQKIQNGLSGLKVPYRIMHGAQTRGNGQQWGSFEGGIMHHTATPEGPAPAVLWEGRPGLSGPLCNSAGEPDGTIVFVAYHPANHAGASGGRSMGPFPHTKTFNKRVWGHEIVYPGTKPMTTQQYRSAVLLGRVIAGIVGGDEQRVRAHAETSVTGKWDPGFAPNKTIDMALYRNAIKTLAEVEMAELSGDQAVMLNLIYTQLAGHGSKPGEFKGWPTWSGGEGAPMTVVDYLRRNNVDVVAIKKQLAAMDPSKLAALVVQQLTPVIQGAVDAAVERRLGNGS